MVNDEWWMGGIAVTLINLSQYQTDSIFNRTARCLNVFLPAEDDTKN